VNWLRPAHVQCSLSCLPVCSSLHHVLMLVALCRTNTYHLCVGWQVSVMTSSHAATAYTAYASSLTRRSIETVESREYGKSGVLHVTTALLQPYITEAAINQIYQMVDQNRTMSQWFRIMPPSVTLPSGKCRSSSGCFCVCNANALWRKNCRIGNVYTSIHSGVS